MWKVAGSDWQHLAAFLLPPGLIVVMGIRLIYQRLVKKVPPPPSFRQAFEAGLRGEEEKK